MRGLVDPSTGEVLRTPEEENLQTQTNKFKLKYQD